jgi:hypothetical protein
MKLLRFKPSGKVLSVHLDQVHLPGEDIPGVAFSNTFTDEAATNSS